MVTPPRLDLGSQPRTIASLSFKTVNQVEANVEAARFMLLAVGQ